MNVFSLREAAAPILIDQRIVSTIDGFNSIVNLFFQIRDRINVKNEVVIDFSNCKEIDGNLSAALGAIFDYAYEKGLKVILTRPTEEKVFTVLSRNHFLEAWQVKTSVEEQENYIRYSAFNASDADSFKQYIDSGLIHKQRFPEHSRLVGEKIVESIYEIYVNACMHGKTDSVYACGEFKPRHGVLEMSIVNLGVSIPKNVNDFLVKRGQNQMSSCDAIDWAFVDGNTTKDVPGGLGLALLKEFIEKNDGGLQVVSDDGMIELKGNVRQRSVLKRGFPGTIVNMKFNFNDKKRYEMASESVNTQDLL